MKPYCSSYEASADGREWPAVVKEPAPQLNPITDKSIGTLSDDTPRVLLDSRKNAQTEETELTLPEARPRTHLRYPLQKEKALRVGILVSRGHRPWNQRSHRWHRFAAFPVP